MIQTVLAEAIALPGISAALPLVGGLELHWVGIGALFGLFAGLALAGVAAFLFLRKSIERMNRDLSNYEAAVAMRFASLEKAISSQAQPPALPTFARMAIQEPVAAVTPSQDNVISLNALRPSNTVEKRLRLTQTQMEESVAANGVSAWFQPVVSLPGRRASYLSSIPYLETDTGTPAAPEQWQKAALKNGLGAQIDRQMALHCIRAARELRRSDKKCGIIWHMGLALLRDEATFAEVEGLLKANRALGKSFVCLIDCSDYRQMTHAEVERLYQLAESGFRLGIGTSTDLTALSNALGSGLFSLACIDAAVLANSGTSAIQNGNETLELVAMGVVDESTAIALIDHDITLAQGLLFAPARPLRSSQNATSHPEAQR